MLILAFLLFLALIGVTIGARARIIALRTLIQTYTTLHDSNPMAASLWRYSENHFELMGYNSAARELYSNWLRTALGKPIHEALEDYPELVQAFRDCVQDRVTVKRNLHITTTRSTINQLKLTVSPMSTNLIVMYMVDESVSYEQPEDILLERNLLHQMMNALGQGLSITDQLHTFVYVNPTFATMLGYEPEDLIGLNKEAFAHPDDIRIIHNARLERERGETTANEIRLQHKNGHYVPCLITGTPRVQNGGIIGEFIAITDLTELTLAHEALYDSELRNQALLGAIPDMMFLQDRQGVFLDYQVTDERIIQDLPKPFLRRRMDEVFPPDLLQHIAPAFKTAISTGDMTEVEYAYQPRNEDIHYFESRLVPYGDNRVLTLTRDITDRKQAEEAVRQSEERYRNLVESLPDIIYVHVDEKLVYINPAGLRGLGAEHPEQLLGINIWDILAPAYHEIVENRLFKIANTGAASPMIEEQFLGLDGRVVDVEVMGIPFTFEGQASVLVIARDIAERKRAEDALKQSEARFRSIFEGADVGIVVTDFDGSPISFNPAYMRIFGYSEEELRGRKIRDMSHPDDVNINKPHIQKLISGEVDRYKIEKRYIHKDGHIIWASLNFSRFPVSDNENDVQIAVFIEDITARKQAVDAVYQLNLELENRVAERTADLTRANQRLQELDRMKTKFISDISHELRTPISVINTRIYLMERGGAEKYEHYLPGLKEHTNRLITFLESIMEVARSEMYEAPPIFQIVNLHTILEETASALSPGAELSGVTLNYHNSIGDLLISGEFNQLSQVVTNLINNALKYTEKGEIHITTFCDEQNQEVGFIIKDSGIGIREDDLPHLFKRFYRGKNAAQSTIPGTGLGLSIVKDILTLHKGTIEVDSQLNSGTTFTITLPRADVESHNA
ncbi:MAG: PAS domain S-box protein [Aggregatilineales bacterium]